MSEIITENFRVVSGFYNPQGNKDYDPSLSEVFGVDPDNLTQEAVTELVKDLVMVYDTANPLEITATLPSGRTIRFSRSLLFTGRVIESGEGNVLVRPGPDSMGLTVALAAVSGNQAELALLIKPQLDSFLRDTQRAVPLGSESLSFDFDSALNDLLGKEDNDQ